MQYVAVIKRPTTGSVLRLEFDSYPLYEIGSAILVVMEYQGWVLQDVLETP